MNPIIYKHTSAQYAFLIGDDGTVDVRKVDDTDGVIHTFKGKKFGSYKKALEVINEKL